MPKLTNLIKTFILGTCFLLIPAEICLAYTHAINFQRKTDSTYVSTSSYTLDSDGVSPDNSQPIYVLLTEEMVEVDCTCVCGCAADINVTVSTTSGPSDSETISLVLFSSDLDSRNYRNAIPLTLRFATSSPTSGDGYLDLEDGQTISVSRTCSVNGSTVTATATASVTNDTVTSSDIVVKYGASFGSSTTLNCNSSFSLATNSKLYVQVTDYDENGKGYWIENIGSGSEAGKVRVVASGTNDTENIILTESGTNTGIFQYTTGLSVQDATTATANNGILEVSATGSTITVWYTDPSPSGETASCSITSGTLLSRFSVSPSSTTQVAGTPFNLTITALKSDSGPLTTYTGTVNLTRNFVSPTSGTYNISPLSAGPFSNGVATVDMTYSDCGTITITATDGSMTGTSDNITFYPYDFSLSASSLDTAATSSAYARHTVNKPFTLGVTARDASGATTPNYQGTANLTINYFSPSTSQSGSLGVSSLTLGYWSSGVATLSSQTYDKWGTISITATDSTRSASTGTSSYLIFLPKDFSISLSSPKPSRTYFYPNEEFSATVTARDYNGSTISNYQGTVSLSGTGLSLPANYTFTTSDAGVHQFSGIYGTTQTSASISAKDATYTSITSESKDVTVKSGTLKVVSTTTPVGKAKLTVKLVDSAGNILTEDDSTTFKVRLTEAQPDNSASSEATTTAVTITDGVASIYVTDNEAEKVTVTPISVSQDLSVESGTVTFGTVAGRGLGIPLWRELKEPTEETER